MRLHNHITDIPSLKLAQKSEIDALESMVKSLSAFSEVEKLVFFGSRVRGDFDVESDMDILIVLTNLEVKERIIAVLHDIELENDMPISPVIFTSKEYEINKRLKSSFVENIEREGILLYAAEHKR